MHKIFNFTNAKIRGFYEEDLVFIIWSIFADCFSVVWANEYTKRY